MCYCTMTDTFTAVCTAIKSSLNVSSAEQKRIERATRKQYSQQEWHIVWAKQITGSKCGKILCQKKKHFSSEAELVPQPLGSTPSTHCLGRHYELVALRKYTAHINDVGHTIMVEECGFIIHPTQGWLGASPDGRVTDEHSEQRNTIVEIKCPYSKHEMAPEAACAR